MLAGISSAVHVKRASDDGHPPGLLRRVLRWVGLIARVRRPVGDEVVLHTVHRAFFLWALILVGLVAARWAASDPARATALGWAYVVTLLLTFAALVFDLGTRKLLLCVGIVAFAWLGAKYVEDLRQVPVLSAFLGWVRDLRPRLDPGTARAVSWVLLLCWVGSIAHALGRGRKAFSPNSIEEWYIGDGSEITDRAGLKFRTRYRDLIETALGFGAGDLEAIDSSGQVVKRWENVLMLYFHWPRLDEILHQRATVVGRDEALPGG